MRHYRALVTNMVCAALTAVMLTAGLTAAKAQVPIKFDGTDWTTDRGNVVFDGVNFNAYAHRPGYNGFNSPNTAANNPNLNSERAVPRWFWPRAIDLDPTNTTNPGAALTTTVIVDNPNPDVNKVFVTNSTQPQDALAAWFASTTQNFVIPPFANRTAFGGFSFTFDPNNVDSFDYGYDFAIHNDFNVNRGSNNFTPATSGELASLPYADSTVYSAVQNVLINPTLSYPVAQWSIGTVQNANAGGGPIPTGVSYNIDLYSPGSGTLIPDANNNLIAHPNVQRAFVRVSWNNTVVGGAFNQAGINDPINSRIYEIDLSQQGWIRIGGSASPAFPDGGGNNQLVVTLYSVTPDNITDTTLYSTSPLVTADAVRFTQSNVTNLSNPGLGPLKDPAGSYISVSGAFLSPVAGTNKLTVNGEVHWFVARSEIVPDPTPRIPLNPTLPVSATNPLVADPSATINVPVFYCLSNADEYINGDLVTGVGAGYVAAGTSTARVVWRYVGYADDGSEDSFASPVIANVKARDGNYHTMVYFAGSSSGSISDRVGRIYALDANGTPATQTTVAYWTYPSIRPVTDPNFIVAATGALKVSPNFEDPNYNGANTAASATYPTSTAPFNTPGHWWGADQLLFTGGAQEYYDGDIVKVPNPPVNTPINQTRTDTQITMGGIRATPTVIPDPGNPTGPMLLLVPSMDGRIYAFDAGGRGDYVLANGNYVPGTTQRLWTWPHYAADAYHHLYPGSDLGSGTVPAGGGPTNTINDEPGKGSMPFSAAYDPNYPFGGPNVGNPILVGGGSPGSNALPGVGHLYALAGGHDLFNGIGNNNFANWGDRRLWSYPQEGTGLNTTAANPLEDIPGVPTIYPSTGAGQRYIYFTSGGRIYSLVEPTSLFSGVGSPTLSWVFPHTPNPPFADPTDATTIEYGQGFAPKGLTVIPAALTGTAQDELYALLNDGTVLAVHAFGNGNQTTTYDAYGPTPLGAFTESTPILTLISPDPNLYSPARLANNAVPPSLPALLMSDDDGDIYAFATTSQSNNAPNNPQQILPLIYARQDAQSAVAMPAGLVGQNVTIGNVNSPSTQGGYFAFGDAYGQLRAYSIAVGNSSTVGPDEYTSTGFGEGYIDIDLREFDVFKQSDWNAMAPGSGAALGSGSTPAHREGGGNYPNTATPLQTNVNQGSAVGVAFDEGGTMYLSASGVYHALPPQGVTPGAVEYGTGPPTITITFTVSQNGTQSDERTVTVTPVTQPPGVPNGQLWPDDRALTQAEKDALHIHAFDSVTGQDAQLTGTQNYVYPWVAKTSIQIIPRTVNGQSTYAPTSGGLVVSVRAEITQSAINTKRTTGNQRPLRGDAGIMYLGQEYDQGRSQSQYPATQNDLSVYQSQQRYLYITNPLALTVRGTLNYPNSANLTGNTNHNIIGWAGLVDNLNLAANDQGLLELLGNGDFVGIESAQAGTGTNNGVALGNQGTIKPVFAPFAMTQDGSSVLYQGVTGNGTAATQQPALFVMDRSRLNEILGSPVHVRVHATPLNWNGTPTSVLNPLPFDQLPDNNQPTVDYPALDPRNLQFQVNGVDALHSTAPLPSPVNGIPVPASVSMIAQVPKYFPANVNRGLVGYNNVTFGGVFTDQAGYVRGAASGGGYQDPNPIMGPLNLATGDSQTLTNGLQAGSPAGGYIGNISVELVPPSGAASTTTGGVGGTRGRVRPPFATGSRTAGQITRVFQTGLSVPPTFRMKVLEQTIDLGSVPHGAGYSSYNGTNGFYNIPFAPTGVKQYPVTTGATNGLFNPPTASPWNDDNQLANLFRPFTLVSDSNVNIVDPRIAKLAGPYGTYQNGKVNVSNIVNNGSLALNPAAGLARSLRLSSDTVNNLLSPPLFAAPFGLTPPSGNYSGVLGNIGIVSSYDHDSYSSPILGELNLWPILNPAIGPAEQQLSQDLSNVGLFKAPWAAGFQREPSIHKPRVNDTSGVTASIPDMPHDYQNAANLSGTVPNGSTATNYFGYEQAQGLFNSPEVGIAVPLGTPVGSYSAPIYPYEDNLPIQWEEWLNASNANYGSFVGNDDGILNTSLTGTPVEPYANPTFTLKVNVRESRLTEGYTSGALPQIDSVNGAFGFNMQPAALMIPGPNLVNKIMLYWTTNRQPQGAAPTPISPIMLAYSSLLSPYVNLNGYIRADAQFTGANLANVQWWGVADRNGNPTNFDVLPGYTGNTPKDFALLFPSTGPNTVPGLPKATTFALGSPAVTLSTLYNVGNGTVSYTDNEAYLTAQGSIDKIRNSNIPNVNAPQETETRTFVSSLNNTNNLGAPDFTVGTDGLLSFLNDPALPKYSPHPLLIKLQNRGGNLPDIKFLYVFWHTGVQGSTALYYNVNIQDSGLGAPFPTNGFQLLGDQKLPTPAAVTWQSDPYPVYRRVYDPTTNQLVNAIDVAFTGVLKSRQTVEVLMARYKIIDQDTPASGVTPAYKRGQLVAIPFPTVHQETLTHTGTPNTWAARDAGWFLPNDAQITDASAARFMRIYLQPGGSATTYLINGISNTGNAAQRGRVDTASGLVYFNAVAVDNAGNVAKNGAGRPIFGGGQVVVDAKSGTVSFPNIPPDKFATIYASYTPYVMRLNTSRDDSNVDRDTSDLNIANPYGNFAAALAPGHPGITSSGTNYAPVLVMDRGINARNTYTSPAVLFQANGTPFAQNAPVPNDRLWALYRKNDPNSNVKSAVYYKAMRLMAKLPLPVALSVNNNGSQYVTQLTITPILHPLSGKGYEVDWVRGRVYFHEEDEGNIVKINYTYFNANNNSTGNSGDLYYRVAWGDEISSTGNSNAVDATSPESLLPSSSYVNEGQVAAFKDPYVDKLWVFWSSTRASAPENNNNPRQIGTTDLFYETIAPLLYPNASNQF